MDILREKSVPEAVISSLITMKMDWMMRHRSTRSPRLWHITALHRQRFCETLDWASLKGRRRSKRVCSSVRTPNVGTWCIYEYSSDHLTEPGRLFIYPNSILNWLDCYTQLKQRATKQQLLQCSSDLKSAHTFHVILCCMMVIMFTFLSDRSFPCLSN